MSDGTKHPACVHAHPCHDIIATIVRNQNLDNGQTKEQEQWLCLLKNKDTQVPGLSSHVQDIVVAEWGMKQTRELDQFYRILFLNAISRTHTTKCHN